uniref:Transcription factor JunB n=1 Tax=Anas platyrhynchos platyrhynchos TaxID=8840 RepID=A0A493TNR6_ANAPP
MRSEEGKYQKGPKSPKIQGLLRPPPPPGKAPALSGVGGLGGGCVHTHVGACAPRGVVPPSRPGHAARCLVKRLVNDGRTQGPWDGEGAGGGPGGVLWGFRVDPMWIPCICHVGPVWFLRGSHVCPMSVLCGFRGDPAWVPCGLRVCPASAPWGSHACPVGVPWGSCGGVPRVPCVCPVYILWGSRVCPTRAPRMSRGGPVPPPPPAPPPPPPGGGAGRGGGGGPGGGGRGRRAPQPMGSRFRPPRGYKAGGRRGAGSSPAAACPRLGARCPRCGRRMCARMEPPFFRSPPFPGAFCRPEPDYGALQGGGLPPGAPPEPFRGLKPAPCPDGGFFGGATGTGGFFYPPPADRDGFVGSFAQALDELHQPGPPNVTLPEPPPGLAAPGGPFQAVPAAAPPPVEAPSEPSGAAPDSPERLQAERRRLRNRLAASRCRRRKLERIARLEQRVRGLRAQNAALAAAAAGLRAQVRRLRGSVRDHAGSGCPLPPGAALGF